MQYPSSVNSSSPPLDITADVVRVRWAKNEGISTPSTGDKLPHISSTPRSLVPAFFYTSSETDLQNTANKQNNVANSMILKSIKQEMLHMFVLFHVSIAFSKECYCTDSIQSESQLTFFHHCSSMLHCSAGNTE